MNISKFCHAVIFKAALRSNCILLPFYKEIKWLGKGNNRLTPTLPLLTYSFFCQKERALARENQKGKRRKHPPAGPGHVPTPSLFLQPAGIWSMQAHAHVSGKCLSHWDEDLQCGWPREIWFLYLSGHGAGSYSTS